MQRLYLSPQQEQERQYNHQTAHHGQLSPNLSYEAESGLNYRYINEISPTHSSFTPPMQDMTLCGTSSYHSQQPLGGIYTAGEYGLGIQMDGYGTPGSIYYSDDGLEGQTLSYFHGQSNSPPTPMSVGDSEYGYHTKSVQRVNRTSSPQSVTTTKTPKSRKQKSNKERVKRLSAPLSELTNDYPNIPVRDMDLWVNRSVDTRHEEVEKKKGKISRPMNSFMLYRSAYAERTKAWCSENNHQVVSSISGESWPMEPVEIRHKYNELAKLERIHHQEAHPDYKFSPSKPGALSRKRKGNFYEDESDPEVEPSDVDDPDAEWGPPGQRKNRPRQTRKPIASATSAPSVGMMSSMFETTNEGRTVPERLDAEDTYQRYRQQEVQTNALNPVVEDVKLKMVDTPGVHNYAAPIIRLPYGGQPIDLKTHFNEGFLSQVDPSLLALKKTGLGAPGRQAQVTNVQVTPISPRSGSAVFSSQHVPEGYAPAQAYPDYQISGWETSAADLRSLETGSEFDNWHT